MAYRGNVCYRKGSPRVHWNIGILNAKNKGPNSRDKKVISFKALAYREAICNHIVGAIYN